MARRSSSNIRDEIIGRTAPQTDSLDAEMSKRPQSSGAKYLAQMLRREKARRPKPVHTKLDLKGPKMHMTQRMWVEKHHQMHDELIARATSYVSSEVRRHEKVVKRSRALHANDLHHEMAARAQKSVLDQGNRELLDLLHRVGERKDQYHGTQNNEWDRLRRRRDRATKRAKAAAKAAERQRLREHNSDVLGRLVRTRSAFDRRGWERDYQRHLERVKIMGRVARPRGAAAGRMRHEYDFDASAPKGTSALPDYHVENDRFAQRWARSKAYKQAVRAHARAERADRRARLKRHSPKRGSRRRKGASKFAELSSGSSTSDSESDY
jgi:hypothetical protein